MNWLIQWIKRLVTPILQVPGPAHRPFHFKITVPTNTRGLQTVTATSPSAISQSDNSGAAIFLNLFDARLQFMSGHATRSSKQWHSDFHRILTQHHHYLFVIQPAWRLGHHDESAKFYENQTSRATLLVNSSNIYNTFSEFSLKLCINPEQKSPNFNVPAADTAWSNRFVISPRVERSNTSIIYRFISFIRQRASVPLLYTYD
jgi:hypothetical protein